MLLFVALFSFLSLVYPGFNVVFFNLFHLYVVSFCLMVYSTFIKRYKIAVFFALFFLINYTTLSSSTNLFFPDKFVGSKNIELNFASNIDLSNYFHENKEASGAIIIAKKFVAPYVIIKENNSLLTLIKVDFRGADKNQYSQIFSQLHQFIVKQDNPVIIFGEFAVPAWDRSFKKFLNLSGLTVKNELIFTSKSHYNFFTTPSFYILGFQEMGVSRTKISEINNIKTIKTNVSFNLAHF